MSKLRVLMYHKVSLTQRDFLTVSLEQLQWQLDYIQKHYNVIKLSDLVAHIELGKALPDNALLITFDDGYANNFELAYPEFKSRQLPFSVFLVANFINKTIEHDGIQQLFLGEQQILDMRDFAEFGYHSLNHENLMDINPDHWENHIKTTLSSCAHLPMVNAWAYTYGQFPKKDIKQFKRLTDLFKLNKLSLAFRIGNRLNQVPMNEPFKIQRLDIRGNESKLKFKLKTWFGKLF